MRVGFISCLRWDFRYNRRAFSHYGSVLKWSTRADCKSVGSAFEGSNPSRPTIICLVHAVSYWYKTSA